VSAVDLLSERLFLTVSEAAELLGVDGRTVRRAIQGGQVPAVRVGTALRVPVAWLREQALLKGSPEPVSEAPAGASIPTVWRSVP
jgi:excisionase family DNA binding protein